MNRLPSHNRRMRSPGPRETHPQFFESLPPPLEQRPQTEERKTVRRVRQCGSICRQVVRFLFHTRRRASPVDQTERVLVAVVFSGLWLDDVGVSAVHGLCLSGRQAECRAERIDPLVCRSDDSPHRQVHFVRRNGLWGVINVALEHLIDFGDERTMSLQHLRISQQLVSAGHSPLRARLW